MTAALCKYRGQLVLMEVVKRAPGTGTGECPECGGKDFRQINGWVECDCGFAINASTYHKINSTRRLRVVDRT